MRSRTLHPVGGMEAYFSWGASFPGGWVEGPWMITQLFTFKWVWGRAAPLSGLCYWIKAENTLLFMTLGFQRCWLMPFSDLWHQDVNIVLCCLPSALPISLPFLHLHSLWFFKFFIVHWHQILVANPVENSTGGEHFFQCETVSY